MFVSNVIVTILVGPYIPHQIKTPRANIYQEFSIPWRLYICYVILKITLRGGYHYCQSYFIAEETEV